MLGKMIKSLLDQPTVQRIINLEPEGTESPVGTSARDLLHNPATRLSTLVSFTIEPN